MPTTIDILPDLAPSVAAQLFERVRLTPGGEAYRYPPANDVGDWISVTWAEAGRHVIQVAAGLLSLGLEAEDRVGIIAGTRYEWILADLGIMCAGGATTTVYPSMNADDTAYILGDAACRFAIVEDVEQLAKVTAHRAELPGLETIVVIEPSEGELPAGVISFEELVARGAAHQAEHPDAVTAAAAAITPDHLATLIYTSGTTGRPKGVRLVHRSWVYEGEALKALGFLYQDDVNFLWLPMSHSFGKVILSAQLAVGYTTAIDGRVDRIIDNLAVIKPTFMGAAPRIFEKAYGKIVATQAAEGGLKEKIFRTAFSVGTRVDNLRREGKSVRFAVKAQYRLFDKLVFRKVRERFGGRVRFFISGSAPLNQEIAEWFHAAGIMIIEGYGLTECAAGGFCGRPIDNKFGTVGRALPGSAVRIAEDGEIQITGPHVMAGYHNLPAETEATLTTDGWLRTGDQGSLDAEGYLTITGRIKDQIKTSGGKIVVPGAIEATFKALCPYTSQFLVFGNGHQYCVALIALDPDAIATWAGENGLEGRPYPEIVISAAAREMVAGYIEQLNSRLNRWETIKKWTILEQDMTIETGELTPSMKVKRGLVEASQAQAIASMYV